MIEYIVYKNILCPECGNKGILMLPWGGGDVRLVCEKKCGFLILTTREKFDKYNYAGRILDYEKYKSLR